MTELEKACEDTLAGILSRLWGKTDREALSKTFRKTFYRALKPEYMKLTPEVKALIEECKKILWIDDCHCTDYLTERNKHENHTACGELEDLKQALKPFEKETGK